MMQRIALLKKYMEQTPDDPFLNHALALEYVKKGETDKAIVLFEKLLEKDPEYIGSYYHLGKALEGKGATKKAAAVYEKGLEVAGKLGDNHARSELQAAYDDLMY